MTGRIAYQGAKGAFSHLACLELRPSDEPVGFKRFDQAIAAVRRGEVGCALIPVENSTIGRVEPAASLVERSGLRILSDAWRPIRLSLLGLQRATLADIRSAESHPIALRQCLATLRRLRIVPVNAFDTAAAAKAVFESSDASRAAIAPVEAAGLYGLKVLREDLQDMADNKTRFVLLGA